MKAMALYLVTGIATGFHWAIYVAPTSPFQYVLLVGSVLLLVAGAVTVFKPRLAAGIAIAAVLGVWSYYAPSLAFSFSRLVTGVSVASPTEVLVVITTTALLAACTVSALKALARI